MPAMRGVAGVGISMGVLVLVACGGVTDPGQPGPGDNRQDSTKAEPADDSDSAASGGSPSAGGASPSVGVGGSGGAGPVVGAGGGGGTVGSSWGSAGSDGGSATYGGAGGAPYAPSICDSPITEELSDWVPREDDLPSGLDLLTAARAVLTGSWHGIVTTPWKPPYSIVATFGADGSYSAHCVENSDYDGANGCCRALYSGSDRDSELKRWSLDSPYDGKLDVAFCYDNEPCYLPVWQGTIENFEYDATENRVRFEFWRGGYGPHDIELERD